MILVWPISVLSRPPSLSKPWLYSSSSHISPPLLCDNLSPCHIPIFLPFHFAGDGSTAKYTCIDLPFFEHHPIHSYQSSLHLQLDLFRRLNAPNEAGMADVEHAPTDNATLLRRIVQLEHGALFLLLPLLCGLAYLLLCSFLQTYIGDRNAHNHQSQGFFLRRTKFKPHCPPERDELRRHVEQLSSSQTNSFGRLDVAARVQGRRATAVEKELEDCQQKLNGCRRENTKLQEELSEVYIIKSKFAELLKVEVEKSTGLEKEVRFFQSRAAAALSDRDRSSQEVEKFQRKEDGLMEKMNELQDRLEQITAEYLDEKNSCAEFQKDLGTTKVDSEVYQKVVERFWKLREQATGNFDAVQIQNKAAILLQDSEDFWSYGEMNKELRKQIKQAKDNLDMLQKDFQASNASVAGLQTQIQEEIYLRRHAEDAVGHCKQQLSSLAELVENELQQIRSAKVNVKEDIASFLQEEGNWLLSIAETWQHMSDKDGDSNMMSKPIESIGTERTPQQELGEANEGLEYIESLCHEADNQHDPTLDGEPSNNMGVEDLTKNEGLVSKTPEEDSQMLPLDQEALAEASQEKLEPAVQEAGPGVFSTVRHENLKEESVNGTLLKDSQMLVGEDCQEVPGRSLQTKAELAKSVGVQEVVEPVKTIGAQEVVEPAKSVEAQGDVAGVNLDEEAGSKIVVTGSQMQAFDDSREALAQALQEKVAALLLLSQQEERHILEENTTSALESQIAVLKQQLLQVTSEKVNALMELAWLHQECLKLQEQEKNFKHTLLQRRTFSGNGLIPVGNYGVNSDHEKSVLSHEPESPRKASLQGYLKHLWLRGPELGSRSKSLSHILSLSRGKDNDTNGIARLRVENASLRESLSSIRHLCKSANRLRLTIARIAADTQTESSIQAAVETVDGVISEALHLKVALHNSLPVNDLGWNSIGSPLAGAREFGQEGSDGEANDDLDVVTFFGLEIVRLVLLAAQLQKRFLGQDV